MLLACVDIDIDVGVNCCCYELLFFDHVSFRQVCIAASYHSVL